MENSIQGRFRRKESFTKTYIQGIALGQNGLSVFRILLWDVRPVTRRIRYSVNYTLLVDLTVEEPQFRRYRGTVYDA